MSDITVSASESVAVSATPVAIAVVDQIKRKLHGGRRTDMNFLSAALDSTTTSVTFDEASGSIAQGAYLEIDTEIMYVRSVNGQVATVRRGMLGTTPASHVDDSQIAVSPRFFTAAILDDMVDEIRSWGSGLFRVPAPVAVAVSTSGDVRGYELSIVPFYDVLQVTRAPATSTTGTWPRVSRYHIDRNAKVSSYPSGVALYLDETSGTNLSVTYSAPFNLASFGVSTDLVGTVGLEESFIDLLIYGTLWRQMSTREIPRTDTGAQGEPRMREEVPPAHNLQAAGALKKIRDERLNEEKLRLIRRWGLTGS